MIGFYMHSYAYGGSFIFVFFSYRYLHNVAVFVKYMIKYVDKVQETEWFNNKIPEGFYTELVGRFAEMCLLITK